MQIIAKLVDMIRDELDGAEEYAVYALKVKQDHPKLAQRFHDLSGVEMQHSNILHDEVVRLIESYRQEHGEPPANMLSIYNYEHEKAIKKAAQVKAMIESFDE